MLKPIYPVACSPALVACQEMMRRFAFWLCDPTTNAASVTQAGLQPPILSTAIEADWLWRFLQKTDGSSKKETYLTHAQTLAGMPPSEKSALNAWVHVISALPTQFQPAPTAWPILQPAVNAPAWKAFKLIMEAFYTKGFKSGLPYLPNGLPTNTNGVTYAAYVQAFRNAHRLALNPDAREVCVLCGGPLGDTPHVDHWIVKSAFPLLSVCDNNLQLICSTCNEAPNKGDKPVHQAGSFAEWFHPYLRSGHGLVKPTYVLKDMSVLCEANHLVDHAKADNLDRLLNLGRRWTKEFKAEYVRHQKALQRREKRRLQQLQSRHTQIDIQDYVQEWQQDLIDSEPHFEVHQELAAALLEPSRLASWHTELQSVK